MMMCSSFLPTPLSVRALGAVLRLNHLLFVLFLLFSFFFVSLFSFILLLLDCRRFFSI